jgi:hypothetical protein
MHRQPLGRFGWGWWDYGICVQYVHAEYHCEVDLDNNRYDEEWTFTNKWESVCIGEWGAYFVDNQHFIIRIGT